MKKQWISALKIVIDILPHSFWAAPLKTDLTDLHDYLINLGG